LAPEAPEIPDIPDWVTEIDGSRLKALLAVAGTLTTIARDPLGWFEDNIAEVLLSIIVDGVLDIGGIIALAIVMAYNQVATVPQLVASPLGDAGGTLFEAGAALIGAINAALLTVTSSTGPFAPILLALLWLIVLAMVLRLISGLISTIRVVNPW